MDINSGDEKFWLESPSDLFAKIAILPTEDMTKEARLNTITRFLLLVSFILYLLKMDQWFTVLVAGIGMVLIIYYFNVRQFKGFRDHFDYHPVKRHSYEPPKTYTTGFRVNSSTSFRKK